MSLLQTDENKADKKVEPEAWDRAVAGKKHMNLKPLLDTLREQETLYDDLIEMAKEEQKALVAGGLPELERLNHKMEGVVGKLALLDKRREYILGTLSAEVSVPKENITLTDLKGRCADEGAVDDIEKLQQNLFSKIFTLQKLSSANTQLIRDSLHYIDFNLNLFASLQENPAAYDSSGNQGKPSRLVVDRKV